MGFESEPFGSGDEGKSARCARLIRREAMIEAILEDSARKGHRISAETAAHIALGRERWEPERPTLRGRLAARYVSIAGAALIVAAAAGNRGRELWRWLMSRS